MHVISRPAKQGLELQVSDLLTSWRVAVVRHYAGEGEDESGALVDSWRFEFKRATCPAGVPGTLRVRWRTSQGLRGGQTDPPRPVYPPASDVLQGLLKDSQGVDQPFGQWCAAEGRSDDSIKALNTYHDRQEVRDGLHKFFRQTELAQLEQLLGVY